LPTERRLGVDAAAMFDYLVAVKNTIGYLNNDISFLATPLGKPIMRKRFGIEFDAASQGLHPHRPYTASCS
jgi:hypothetical protein